MTSPISTPRRACRPRRARAEQLPHDQPEIEGAGVHEQPLEDVLMAAQVRPAHRSGLVQMRKRAFHAFGAATQQLQASVAADPSPIRVDARLRVGDPIPPARSAIGLGDAGPDAERVQVDERSVAVIALVGNQFVETGRRAGAFGCSTASTTVFVEHVGGGPRRLVSTTHRDSEGNGISGAPVIDATGSRVVFESTATNLGCGSPGTPACDRDINMLCDIFLWDRNMASVTRMNTVTRELPWLEGGSHPTISADGRAVAFLSRQPVSHADGRDTFDLFVTQR